MPFYDYKCTSCGNRIEVIHGVNDLGPGACDRCGGPMRKMLSSPSIVFKGSGWAKKERSTSSRSGKGADSDGASADKSPDKSAGDPAPGGDTGKSDAGTEKSAASGKAVKESSTGSGSGDAS